MRLPREIRRRWGDCGTTSLRGGARVRKDHPRLEACGDLDELGAALGAARAFARRKAVRAALLGVQKDLLEIGSILAGPPPAAAGCVEERLAALDRLIGRCRAKLPPLRGFIARGGTPGSSFIHWACTVCRRAERRIVTLSRGAAVPPEVTAYINRLSTLLFMLARMEDREGG